MSWVSDFFLGMTRHLVLWLAFSTDSLLSPLLLVFQLFVLLLPFSFHKYSALAQNQLLVLNKETFTAFL